jgi:hypothetical protein
VHERPGVQVPSAIWEKLRRLIKIKHAKNRKQALKIQGKRKQTPKNQENKEMLRNSEKTPKTCTNKI